MTLFHYLSQHERERVFYLSPQPVSRKSERDTLAYSLGATLYMPGTRSNLAQDLLTQRLKGCTSSVICLEDAIGDKEVESAQRNVLQHLHFLSIQLNTRIIREEQLPFIFVRVRSPQQMKYIVEQMKENIHILTGFVFPKFSIENGKEYLDILEDCNVCLDIPLYGMPVLETASIAYKESRMDNLHKIRAILYDAKSYILNIRIGATDFSSCFGLRRGASTTIYDIVTIRDCISDIMNVFGRAEENNVISGPVWEYFPCRQSILGNSLGQNMGEEVCHPYIKKNGSRNFSYSENYLIRETLLDRENGMIGKTVIHPSHIFPVQALYVVTYEEYIDACHITKQSNGQLGVMRSQYGNKMNEIKPHLNWAKKIMKRAQVYGVYHEDKNFTHFFTESVLI